MKANKTEIMGLLRDKERRKMRQFKLTHPSGRIDTLIIRTKYYHQHCKGGHLLDSAESWCDEYKTGWKLLARLNTSGHPVAIHPSGARAEYVELCAAA